MKVREIVERLRDLVHVAYASCACNSVWIEVEVGGYGSISAAVRDLRIGHPAYDVKPDGLPGDSVVILEAELDDFQVARFIEAHTEDVEEPTEDVEEPKNWWEEL